MEHLDFTLFSAAVNAKFQALAQDSNLVLASTNVDSEALYEVYLEAYPKAVNGIFRERRHYDGTYDKNFIRRIGDLVAIDKTGKLDTIWNVEVPGYFQDVANAMHQFVLHHQPVTAFLTDMSVAGNKANRDNVEDIIWNHFHSVIPSAYVVKRMHLGTQVGRFNEDVGVFTRGLKELSIDSLETVLELINANSLYRGAEHKDSVKNFLKLKKEFAKVPAVCQEPWILYTAKKVGPSVRFKNTVIGTLIEDLSSGVDLEKAVASFESKVAPSNYKRPTALVTPKMIEAAQAKIEELGLTSALSRRSATIEDINISNVLFTSQNQKSLSVFDDLQADANSAVNAKALAKVEEVSLEHFLTNIIPSAKTIEVLFENKHVNNLVTLTTSVEPDAPNLFKWDNNFSWSYNGEVADSLRDRVQALGGRVDGALRFSHSWNHDGQNQSLMDLHVFGPDCQPWLAKYKDNAEEIHERYPTGLRVGWNNRKDHSTGGTQDVDYTSEPGKNIPVENITFPHLNKLPEGTYTFKIHNWRARNPNTSGFKAEIEFDGNVFNYEYNRPVKHHQWITVAEATLKNGKFTIEHKMSSEASSKTVWGIETNKWVKVNNIMLSPNAWNQEARTGNEHLFFIIDDCKNENKTRGIYNEFLRPEFEAHRKVFELLGDKTKVEPADNQASGLGFSSTRRDKVTVRVSGKTKRTFVINL